MLVARMHIIGAECAECGAKDHLDVYIDVRVEGKVAIRAHCINAGDCAARAQYAKEREKETRGTFK